LVVNPVRSTGMCFEAPKSLVPLMLEYHLEVYGGLDVGGRGSALLAWILCLLLAIALVRLRRSPQPIVP
jgi:hypothetical protein